MKSRYFLLITISFVFLNMGNLYSQGERCASIEPFCAGDSRLVFPNSNPQSGGLPNAEAGPFYGCLITQPYPAWYFMQIGTSGNLRFRISQSENRDGSGRGIDVDFIVWGPFSEGDDYCSNASLSQQNTIDCSYEPDFIEQMTIPNARAGDIYIVMITNYDAIPGFISLEQINTGGGSTDCSIIGSTLGPDQKICGEEEVLLDATNEQASEYVWFVLNDETGEYEIIEGETGPKLRVTGTGNYQVTVRSDFFGSEESDQVLIEFFNPPVAFEPDPVFGCAVESGFSIYDLTSAGPKLIGNNSGTYNLRFYLNQQDFENGVVIENPAEFNQNINSVLATIINTESTCESQPVRVQLEKANPPEIGWKDLTPVCIDLNGNFLGPVSLGEDLGPGYIYTWSIPNDPDGDGKDNPVFTFTSLPTVQSLSLEIVNIDTGCSSTYETDIGIFSPPGGVEVNIAGNDFDRDGYTVTATVVGSVGDSAIYEYRLNNGPWQLDPIFRRVPGGTYRITAREINGCGSATSRAFRLVGYPRFFTPNADGYNDTWNVINDPQMSITRVVIFDRFGKLIKELSPVGAGWDGSFRGQDMPADDYWFLVYFRDDEGVQEFKGHFSLMR